MKNDIKAAIIVGIMVTLLWGCYVTFIYMDNPQESMDKREKCVEPMNASTKVCNSKYFPEVYTNFGGMQ